MRTTGIIRRIDELGRVVIPKEIRRTMRLRVGEEMEIFIEENQLVLKKFSSIFNIGQFAAEYSLALSESLKCTVLICDTEKIVSASGDKRRDYENKFLSKEAEKLLAERTIRTLTTENTVSVVGEDNFPKQQIFAPIIVGGDIAGGFILISFEGDMNSLNNSAVEIASNFFSNILQ
ncbi:MAG: stage V sporulation T C-terminal domain-containing protein [Clostridia bacterium]